MLVVLSKWRVVVAWLGEQENVVFYVGDMSYQNVLRKIAEIEWASVPHSITVERSIAATDPITTQFSSTTSQQSETAH